MRIMSLEKKIVVILLNYIIRNFNLAAIQRAQLIVSTLPFITSTVEQSFATLHRVKAWPRSILEKAQKICTSDLCIAKKHDVKIKICKNLLIKPSMLFVFAS